MRTGSLLKLREDDELFFFVFVVAQVPKRCQLFALRRVPFSPSSKMRRIASISYCESSFSCSEKSVVTTHFYVLASFSKRWYFSAVFFYFFCLVSKEMLMSSSPISSRNSSINADSCWPIEKGLPVSIAKINTEFLSTFLAREMRKVRPLLPAVWRD